MLVDKPRSQMAKIIARHFLRRYRVSDEHKTKKQFKGTIKNI